MLTGDSHKQKRVGDKQVQFAFHCYSHVNIGLVQEGLICERNRPEFPVM